MKICKNLHSVTIVIGPTLIYGTTDLRLTWLGPQPADIFSGEGGGTVM